GARSAGCSTTAEANAPRAPSAHRATSAALRSSSTAGDRRRHGTRSGGRDGVGARSAGHGGRPRSGRRDGDGQLRGSVAVGGGDDARGVRAGGRGARGHGLRSEGLSSLGILRREGRFSSVVVVAGLRLGLWIWVLRVERVRLVLLLVTVRDAVTISVGLQWIGAVSDLLGVLHPIAVRVGAVGIGAEHPL